VELLKKDPRKNKLEKEIALLIAQILKEATGRGPAQLKSCIAEDLFLLRIKGFLCESEVLVSRTEKGRDIVKRYRLELINEISPKILENIKTLFLIEPDHFFIDIDPQIDEGVIVITFKRKLPKDG